MSSTKSLSCPELTTENSEDQTPNQPENMSFTQKWIKLIYSDSITFKSLSAHFLNHLMCYLIIGIYLLDNNNRIIHNSLYLIARIYTVNKYKKYCTEANGEVDWSSVIVLILYHVSFTEAGRIIFDISKFSFPRAFWSYISHYGVLVGLTFKDFNPRQIKDLNVMSKFRKALNYHRKFGNFFLDRREYSLNNTPKIIFFMYIYNNTSNCILWITEIFNSGRYHYKDFARFTVFKILLIFIVKIFMDFEHYSEIWIFRILILAVFTYLFSLVEVEFMKEDLILKERFRAAKAIDKYARTLKHSLSSSSFGKGGKKKNVSKTMTDLDSVKKEGEKLPKGKLKAD